jgi:hypothetical protein
MHLTRTALVLWLSLSTAVLAHGQHADARKQFAEIRRTLDALDWQKVDFEGLSLLQRCRALMLLNHALDELGAAALAEVDLMGAYLEQQDLHAAYVAKPPEIPPRVQSFEDARKIAAALLKGPMASSRYATELSDTDDAGLKAYENLYEKTCREKWDGFMAHSKDLRSMAAFLNAKGKTKDYMAWAPAETDRRHAQHETEMAARRAAVVAKHEQTEHEQQTRAAELEKQQQERAASRHAQQALLAAAQSSQAAAQPAATAQDEDDDDWYPGWYNGVIDNAKRHTHRDGAYQSGARARVEQRRTGASPTRRGGRP